MDACARRRVERQEIKQLRDNAERLNEPSVVELCRAALQDARSSRGRALRKPGPRTRAGRLIARVKAFEARSVFLQDARTSWSGVRKADGKVVMALWADAVETAEAHPLPALGAECGWLAAVVRQARWQGTPGHCKRALELGSAEGLLVYGQGLATHLPEDKAFEIHGVDAETVLTFEVEQVGAEFWAKWGKKAAASGIERR